MLFKILALKKESEKINDSIDNAALTSFLSMNKNTYSIDQLVLLLNIIVNNHKIIKLGHQVIKRDKKKKRTYYLDSK